MLLPAPRGTERNHVASHLHLGPGRRGESCLEPTPAPRWGSDHSLDFHLLFTYAVVIRGARLAYRPTEGSRTAATGRQTAAPGNPERRSSANPQTTRHIRLHHRVSCAQGLRPVVRGDPPSPGRLLAQRGRQARHPAPPTRLPGARASECQTLAGPAIPPPRRRSHHPTPRRGGGGPADRTHRGP